MLLVVTTRRPSQLPTGILGNCDFTVRVAWPEAEGIGGPKTFYSCAVSRYASQRGIFAILEIFGEWEVCARRTSHPPLRGKSALDPPGGIPSAGVSARRFDQAKFTLEGRKFEIFSIPTFGEIWRNFETL